MHRKLSSAIAAVHAAAAACRKGGDLQGVNLQAYEQDSSGHYWEADLTDEERDQIAAR